MKLRFILPVILTPALALSAPLDCDKKEAMNTVDVFICSDNGLANIARQVEEQNKQALNIAANGDKLKKDQISFNKSRLESCPIEQKADYSSAEHKLIINCLKGVYQKRLDTLKTLVANLTVLRGNASGTPPPNYNTSALLLEKCVKYSLLLNNYMTNANLSPLDNMLFKCSAEYKTLLDACDGKPDPAACRQNAYNAVSMEVQIATDPYRHHYAPVFFPGM